MRERWTSWTRIWWPSGTTWRAHRCQPVPGSGPGRGAAPGLHAAGAGRGVDGAAIRRAPGDPPAVPPSRHARLLRRSRHRSRARRRRRRHRRRARRAPGRLSPTRGPPLGAGRGWLARWSCRGRSPAGAPCTVAIHRPSLQVDVGTTFAEYEASLGRNRRQQARCRWRRLGERGEVEVEVRDATEALDRLLAEGFAVEASGWKGASGTAITSSPAQHRLYTELARSASERGSCASTSSDWTGSHSPSATTCAVRSPSTTSRAASMRPTPR